MVDNHAMNEPLSDDNAPPVPHLHGNKHHSNPVRRPVPFKVWACFVSGCFFLAASGVGIIFNRQSLESNGVSILLAIVMLCTGFVGLVLEDRKKA